MDLHELPHPQQRAFLHAYARCASITKAAEAVGIDRTCHYKWLEADRQYRIAFERTEPVATQHLEDEAVRRATEPVYLPILTRTGKIKGYYVKPPSDQLLMQQLKARRPERYQDRQEVTHTGAIEHRIAAVQQASDAELQEYLRRCAEARRLGQPIPLLRPLEEAS